MLRNKEHIEVNATPAYGERERSHAYHVLHADGDLVVNPKVAEEANNVRRVALMQDLQLPHDLVPHSRFDVQHDHLEGGREEGASK